MAVVGHVKEIWRYPVKSMAGERRERADVAERGIPGDRGWALRDEAAAEIRGAKKMPILMRCRATYSAEPRDDAVPPVTITLPDETRVRSSDSDVDERLSTLVGRTVKLCSLRPAEDRDHYRRGQPDDPDLEKELRQVFGRLPDEPLPDLSVVPPEIFEFTSPLGTYFDLAPVHLLTTASLRALAACAPTARFERARFRPNFLVAPTDGASGFVETAWCGRKLRVGGVTIAVTIPTMRCSMTTRAVDDLPADPSVLRAIVRDANQNLGVYASVEAAGEVAVGDPVELV